MKYLTGIRAEQPVADIQAALERFERRFGVTLTIHDCRGVFCFSDGSPFFPGRWIHRHEYCMRGRFERSSWNRRCHEACMLGADAMARRSGRPFLHTCWKAGAEVVVPVQQKGGTVLIFYAGVFRSGEMPPEELPAELLKLHDSLPPCDEKLQEELTAELQLLGQGMLSFLENLIVRGGLPEHSRAAQILFFITRHAHEEISLRELAACLHLSETHCCHQVRYHFGVSFQRLLTEERMRRARNLLANTDKPLKLIASDTGLRNECYFSRIFRRENGISPGQYRREMLRRAEIRRSNSPQ